MGTIGAGNGEIVLGSAAARPTKMNRIGRNHIKHPFALGRGAGAARPEAQMSSKEPCFATNHREPIEARNGVIVLGRGAGSPGGPNRPNLYMHGVLLL